MAAMIASKFAEKIKDQPNYRPVDIVLDAKHEFGVDITYSKAFRAREAALELNNGTHEDAYKNLPQYCQDLEAVDPKTKASAQRITNSIACFSAMVPVQLDSPIVALVIIRLRMCVRN